MFWPPKNVTVFHSKLLLDNCKFHIIRDEKLLSKMEGKTNFSRRLKQLDGLTDWPSPPIIYDKSTPVLKGPPPQNYQKLCLPIINRNPNPNPYWSFFAMADLWEGGPRDRPHHACCTARLTLDGAEPIEAHRIKQTRMEQVTVRCTVLSFEDLRIEFAFKSEHRSGSSYTAPIVVTYCRASLPAHPRVG